MKMNENDEIMILSFSFFTTFDIIKLLKRNEDVQ